MHECTHRGLGTPTLSQHNIFDSKKLSQIFLVLLTQTGFKPPVFGSRVWRSTNWATHHPIHTHHNHLELWTPVHGVFRQLQQQRHAVVLDLAQSGHNLRGTEISVMKLISFTYFFNKKRKRVSQHAFKQENLTVAFKRIKTENAKQCANLQHNYVAFNKATNRQTDSPVLDLIYFHCKRFVLTRQRRGADKYLLLLLLLWILWLLLYKTRKRWKFEN